MTAFRKWFVALAVLVVMVGTASAQAFQCTANAGVPNRVRGEGLTELVGDLLLNCSGVKPAVPAGTAVLANVQIFLSVNVTSRITATATSPALSTTEALLAKDDPSGTTNDPIGPPPGPTLGTNVWQGGLAGANSLLWTNIPIIPAAVPPGSTYSTIIRITNVRGNASQAGIAAGAVIPNQIQMFVSVTSSTSIPINNPTQVVAAVLKGLDFTARNCADDGSFSTPRSQCSSLNSGLMTDPTRTGRTIEGLLKYSEGFDAAWKTRGSQIDSVWGVYPLTQPVESAYTRVAWASTIGYADTGTRLIARFANIPAGVKLFVSANRAPSGVALPAGSENATVTATTTAGVRAVLVSVTDPTGTGGAAGFPLAGTAQAQCGGGTAGAANMMMLEVQLFGGAGAATWEIMASSGTAIEAATFGVTIAYASSPATNIPALSLGTLGTASGGFAPISAVGTASAAAPIPRFTETLTSRNIINVLPCVSNLLFPFVTARGGFDTGIAISNTTLDNSKDLPGGTADRPYASAATNGACTLYYFGDKEDGTSLAKPVQKSSVLAAGKQLVYTLFGGGGGIDATPSFQGYIIATCDFHLAHGFAFISDLGAQKLAMGYLALVIPTANGDARPVNESLGH